MAFLQISSTHAYQNITYFCKNSVAYFDAVEKNHNKAVRLMSWNDKQLRADGSHMFTYKVPVDECQVSELQNSSRELTITQTSCETYTLIALFINSVFIMKMTFDFFLVHSTNVENGNALYLSTPQTSLIVYHFVTLRHTILVVMIKNLASKLVPCAFRKRLFHALSVALLF